MFTIKKASKFKKDYKAMKKRGFDINLLYETVDKLRMHDTLPAKYNVHLLTGKYKGFSECHIKPDWLLIYRYDYNKLALILIRTGTHSDLF